METFDTFLQLVPWIKYAVVLRGSIIDYIEFYHGKDTLKDVKIRVYKNEFFGELSMKTNNILDSNALNENKGGGLKNMLINIDDKKVKELFMGN